MTLTAIAIRPSPDQAGAILAITETLKPAARGVIMDALTRLGENVAAPFDSDPDVRLDEWTNFLSGYPADSVFTALAEWPNANVKWPNRAEIKPILDALSLRRRRMLVALQGLNAKVSEDDLYPQPSADEVAAVRARCAEVAAALRASGKPKKPERRLVDELLEADRRRERETVQAALHPEIPT